ncbi:MAG: hypothetical protein NC099_06035 [Corallococcus sp.]|nr:hypothetical protein [Bacillota bacterium]MCM1534193.1 hypothetical protein [Corallococcus sp.]
MDINELAETIIESDNACAQCACVTDDECMSADCRDKILEYLRGQSN